MLLLLLAQLLVGEPNAIDDPADLTKRYALLIGSNVGNPEEGTLEYATADARNVATTLESVAGFARARMVVLTNPTATDVRTHFQNLKRLMESESGNKKMLAVYYSGHADVISIHLGGTQLSWEELVKLTNSTDAGTRLIIADACRSGELTQVKGAVVDQPFVLPNRGGALPLGIAIITSASAGETAQESPSFHGSFFTHHFLAALRGAADQNGDGQITLEEAFSYSSAQTLFDTAKTMTGAQHATYRVKMRGRGNLTLSYPKASTGLATLSIADPGYYLLRGGKSADTYIMELQIPAHGERKVWLAAGDYQVQRRAENTIYTGEIKLQASALTHLKIEDLSSQRTVAYAGKGGNVPRWACAYLFGTAGTPLFAGQGPSWGGGLGFSGRVYRRLWLDILSEILVANGTSGPWSISQLGVSLAGGARILILENKSISLFGGARAGAAVVAQSYDGYPSLQKRQQAIPGAEVFASLEVSVFEPVALKLEAGPRLEYPDMVQSNGRSGHRTLVSGYVRLGVAATF